MEDGLTKRARLQLRKAELWNERSTWMARYEKITKFLLPYAGRYFVTDRNKGDRSFNSIYDESGTYAHDVLSAGLMAGMTSPARPWFQLATPDRELMEYQPVKEWLFRTSELLRAIFAKSNTYNSLHSLYEELGAFATGATIIEPNFKNVLHHNVLTAGEYAIAVNDLGEVDTLAREFDMTIMQIVEKFVYGGNRNAKPDWSRVSDTVKTMWDTRAFGAWVTVGHLIQPRLERDYSRRDAVNMPTASCYFELGRENADDRLLRESGYKEFPALVPRWNTRGGDFYGNGPAFRALGSIQQLQQEQLRKGQGIDYKTKPPLQVPIEMRNSGVSTLPGGISYVASQAQGRKIESLFDVNLDLSHLLEDIRDVRERINRSFYVDLFLMISQDNRRTPATATEIAERHEEKLLMLGPVLERLHNELLSPKIDVAFARCLETGILPPVPEELAGQELRVDFISPLAIAQKMVGLSGLDRLIGTVAQISAAKQDLGVWDKIDVDQTIDRYSDMLGVDPSTIIADDKVAIIRQSRAEAMQKQMQMDQATQAAAAAKDVASIDTTEPNALTDVMRAVSGYNASV